VRSLRTNFISLGSTFVWLADEWFLIAGQELPPESEYEDYPQIDRCGFHSLFLKQFSDAAQQLPQFLHHDDSWVVGNINGKSISADSAPAEFGLLV